MTYQCNLEIKSFNFKLIETKINFIQNFLNQFEFIQTSGPITLPLKKKKFTLLRSPHNYKKSQEHFGMFNYKTIIKITFPSEKIMTMVINYLKKTILFDSEVKFIKKISYKY